VTERIAVRAEGNNIRRGIYRDFPTRYKDRYGNRVVVDFQMIDVQRDGKTEPWFTENKSNGVRINTGNDDFLPTPAEFAYTLHYRTTRQLGFFADHDELYWNAIGDGWEVPIDTATVRVVTLVTATREACFAGPTGSSLPCGSIDSSGSTVTAAQPAGLAPHDAFTVVVGLPREAVRATGPHLEERWTFRRSVTPTPLTGALAGLVLVPGLAGVALLVARVGRDRRYAGQTPGLVPTVDAVEERVPLVGTGPVAVAFQPPEGLRPGQLGTLLDERASVLDVTATIVDLAVRGHLRIVELERPHWFTSRDWRLERLTGGTGELLPFEKTLYDGLFLSGDQVLLSSLKKTFAARMAKVQTALYQDVTRAGWFRVRPDQVRSGWRIAGLALAVGGGWLTWLLSHQLHWAPVGAAVSLVGIALLALSRRMPARTALGTAVLAQAKGFREYLRTAEADQLRFEEGQDIFSRYLPYAIVFGEADRWVRVFGPLAASSPSAVGGSTSTGGMSWYAGPAGWDLAHFGDSLDSFTSSASSTLATATPSSSGGSGFSGGGSSGGGGGGGGGGSW
jgi:uncharacterized membrane protein YgcG